MEKKNLHPGSQCSNISSASLPFVSWILLFGCNHLHKKAQRCSVGFHSGNILGQTFSLFRNSCVNFGSSLQLVIGVQYSSSAKLLQKHLGVFILPYPQAFGLPWIQSRVPTLQHIFSTHVVPQYDTPTSLLQRLWGFIGITVL